MLNLDGETYGHWTAIKRVSGSHYLCRCVCGIERSVRIGTLRAGKTTNCGCQKWSDLPDAIGDWTVIGRSTRNILYWDCRCVCGKESAVRTTELKNGRSTGCGCRRSEKMSSIKRTHGLSTTRVYNIWATIKQRCGKARNHKDYYGRGISMDPRWAKDFAEFYKDVGDPPSDKHSLDRKDNEGNYEPGNVRWATQTTQGRNRRNTLYATIDGVTKSIKSWCEETGIPYGTAHTRITHYGFTPEDAVTKPIKRRRDDLRGKQFGEWTALEPLEHSKWLCECSCGTLRRIQRSRLTDGTTKSCGCQQSQNITDAKTRD